MKSAVLQSRIKILLVSGTLALLMGACSARDNRMGQGALLGGAGGALVGGLASGTGTGALIGGAVGATAGALIADATRPRWRHRHTRCHSINKYGRATCRG